MKCILCNSRKAKRYCPAKRDEICPICCGEKRGVEIDCPLDCRYFIEGQKHHQQKVMKQRIRKDGAQAYVRRAQLYSQNPELYAQIEITIAETFGMNKRLRDEDLASALKLVADTLETEQKGILYKHSSDNRYANEISDKVMLLLRNFIDRVGEGRITTEFARKVVEDFYEEFKFNSEIDPKSQTYLRHVYGYHQDKLSGEKKETGNIIIT